MMGFREIHSHLLCGVDDGPQTKAAMEAMVDSAYANGITSIYATPHVTPGVYPIDDALIMQRLYEAQAYCQRKQYPIEILPGAEILFTPAIEHLVLEKKLPTLAHSQYILVEFVPDIQYSEICAALEMLDRSGYIVILAHIERYRSLRTIRKVVLLKEQYQVLYQVNCSSILRKNGFFMDRFINRCMKRQLIDFVASDAHDCERRPFKIRKAYSYLTKRFGQEYAARLTGLDDQ